MATRLDQTALEWADRAMLTIENAVLRIMPTLHMFYNTPRSTLDTEIIMKELQQACVHAYNDCLNKKTAVVHHLGEFRIVLYPDSTGHAPALEILFLLSERKV